jgi:hypothetical protein
VQLNCPRGTTISIEFAQYGKYGGDPNDGLCPETTEDTQKDGNVINSGTEIEIKTTEKCMWPQALQVSKNIDKPSSLKRIHVKQRNENRRAPFERI